MEMTGRMESVENLSEQRRGFASQRQVSHPSHRPLEIAARFPHSHSLDDDDFFLSTRGHFYWALTVRYRLQDYRTPYEKLLSLDNWESHLKPGIRAAFLEQQARRMSDTECALRMQQRKRKLLAGCRSRW